MRGATVWFTGLPASGKTTLAEAVAASLRAEHQACFVVDGDDLRRGLTSDLGFSREDRGESVRRAGEVALLLSRAGVVPLVSLVSPYREDREKVRSRHTELGLGFVEVHVATPLAVCETRDPKGLYGKARRGELGGMTGVDDPYEPPEHAEVVCGTGLAAVEDEVTLILQSLKG